CQEKVIDSPSVSTFLEPENARMRGPVLVVTVTVAVLSSPAPLVTTRVNAKVPSSTIEEGQSPASISARSVVEQTMAPLGSVRIRETPPRFSQAKVTVPPVGA